MGTLTVRENLRFSAALRLPSSVPQREKEARVNHLLRELGLTKVADSKVHHKAYSHPASLQLDVSLQIKDYFLIIINDSKLIFEMKMFNFFHPFISPYNFHFPCGLSIFFCSKVGTQMTRGISGGERKRTSIGMELIIDPAVLFLDEPTTGLDASTANSVLLLLKRWQNSSCFVVFRSYFDCTAASKLMS